VLAKKGRCQNKGGSTTFNIRGTGPSIKKRKKELEAGFRKVNSEKEKSRILLTPYI